MSLCLENKYPEFWFLVVVERPPPHPPPPPPPAALALTPVGNMRPNNTL